MEKVHSCQDCVMPHACTSRVIKPCLYYYYTCKCTPTTLTYRTPGACTNNISCVHSHMGACDYAGPRACWGHHAPHTYYAI
eukprot:11837427-Alexandrium_andersonii.AAC.1